MSDLSKTNWSKTNRSKTNRSKTNRSKTNRSKTNRSKTNSPKPEQGKPQHSKSDLRARLRAQRRDLDENTAARAAALTAKHLCNDEVWQRARHIGLYLANDGELSTAEIAQQGQVDGKCLYLPAIVGKALEFRPWMPGETLTNNRYGIGETSSPCIDPSELELLLMPVVGWAMDGTRLGMGGGFYDRFLADQATDGIVRVGLAYAMQQDPVISQLCDPWDQKLHSVVTEESLFKAAPGADAKD